MRDEQRRSPIGFRLRRRESSAFSLRATTLAPLRSLKAVRQSFGPEEQGAQPAPPATVESQVCECVCEFACAC
jgi:hypothetical protein